MLTKVTNPERLRYQPNRLSFLLCLLAICFNIAALITAYGSTTISPNVVIGLDVIVNIVFMLVCFMASEKTKAYSMIWGKAVIVIGAMEMLRIFMVPLTFFVKNEYSITSFLLNSIFYIGAGVSLIFAGLICIERTKILKEHLKSIEE